MIIQRKIWDKIERWMNEPEIIVIKGPRQAGKTTTMKYLQSKYGGIYLTLEDDDIREAIERDPKGFIKLYLKEKIIYLDEAQYIKSIGHVLKMWYDLYGIKLVVSGSGSFDIKVDVGRYLVGRLVYFEIYPLSFDEFLSFKNPKIYKEWKEERERIFNLLNGKKVKLKPFAFVNEARRELNEYLKYGGFPRIVTEEDSNKKEKLLKDLYQTYIERDILHFMNIRNINKFDRLTKILASKPGQGINFSGLSSISEINQVTLREYLDVLERTYIIRLVKPFLTNRKKVVIKRSKVYFTDIGLRNAIINDFSEPWGRVDVGDILENFAVNEIFELQPKYYRTLSGAEVDLVIKDVPIEIKTSGKPKKAFYNFMKEFNSTFGIVFWNKELKVKDKVYFIPIWMI